MAAAWAELTVGGIAIILLWAPRVLYRSLQRRIDEDVSMDATAPLYGVVCQGLAIPLVLLAKAHPQSWSPIAVQRWLAELDFSRLFDNTYQAEHQVAILALLGIVNVFGLLLAFMHHVLSEPARRNRRNIRVGRISRKKRERGLWITPRGY